MTGDDVFHADPLAAGRLAITGAVSDPCARTIVDPRRFRRRTDALVGTVLYGLLFLVPWALLMGLVYLIARAAVQLWRWAEPLLTVLAVGVAVAVIVLGIGHPG